MEHFQHLPAVYIVVAINAFLHTFCLGGFTLLRKTSVFAIRAPEVVMLSMLGKLINFVALSWLFLDPNCPCMVLTFGFWAEWVGNFCNVQRKFVLLFRYEIQSALDESKAVGAAAFENNVYVRWRQFLWPRYQIMCVVVLVLGIGVGNILILSLYPLEAGLPCLNDPLVDNPLVLGNVIVSWAYFVPLTLTSLWSTRKLKKYPKDNWKMGVESTFTSLLSLSHGLFSIIVLITNPYLDSILFFFLVYCVMFPILNFFVPLQLHRKTIAQLAQLDVRHLAPLARLLKEPVFFKAFEAFLHTEFSSETISFWKDVETMKGKYRSLLPAHMVEVSSAGMSQQSSKRAADPPASEEELVPLAAQECVAIGQQYIGDKATWQVNISSATVSAVGAAVEELSKTSDKGEMRAWVEDLLRALLVAQGEVYDTLTKDSYPRFLLSPACRTVTENKDLKKLLAAEKLELEAHAAPSASRPSADESERGSEVSRDQSRKKSGAADQPSKFRFQAAQSIQLDTHSRAAPPEDISELDDTVSPRRRASEVRESSSTSDKVATP